jgi:hypothetical protein
MAARKLWATQYADSPNLVRHQSKVAVYRQVQRHAALWGAGEWTARHLTVLVDDGQGWMTYERIDLAELAHRPIRTEGTS